MRILTGTQGMKMTMQNSQSIHSRSSMDWELTGMWMLAFGLGFCLGVRVGFGFVVDF